MMLLAGSSRSRGSSNNHDELFRRIATAETPEDNKWIVDYITSKSKFTSITDNALNGPLHAAIRHRKFELLSLMLSTNALPINLLNLSNDTPLHMCLREKIDIQVLEKLIAAGADVNIITGSLRTPLHLAMKCDHRYTHLLIRHGALDTINKQDVVLRTPLHYAVTGGNFDNVFLLLYYNADANIEDFKKQTPFMLAIRDPENSIQDILLEYENIFILNKNEYEHDTYTQNRLHKLLRTCIRYNNLEMFRKIWSRIPPEIKELIPDQSPHLIQYAPFDFIDFMLRDDYIDLTKIEILTLKFCPPFRDIWQAAVCEDGNKQIKMFTDTVYLFLSYGGIFSMGDIQFLQKFQQNETIKELIRVLLYMDIDKSFEGILREFSDIPYIIPYVMCNIHVKFEDIIDDYCHQCFTWFSQVSFSFEEIENNMQQFFRFSTSDKFLKLYKQSVISQHYTCTLEIPEVNVPSLVELSRNRAKDRICEKYKIKNACQFYTILESLPVIPRKMKDIIAFRTPIYEEIDCQIIKVPVK